MLLDLYRDVLDPAAVSQAVVDLLEDPLVLRGVGDDRVAAHGEVSAGEGPDVEVVDVLEGGHVTHRLVDLGEVDVSGGGLEEDVDGLPDEAPAADEDEAADASDDASDDEEN